MKFRKAAVFSMTVLLSVAAFSMKASAYNSTDLTTLCEHLPGLPTSVESNPGYYNAHEDYDGSGNPILDIRDLIAMKKQTAGISSSDPSGGYTPGENETPFIPKD